MFRVVSRIAEIALFFVAAFLLISGIIHIQ
ncbi:hypothetical protein BH10PLA1_BH10PLA1_01700 [soil metagenome]